MAAMIAELTQAAERLDADDAVRAVVLAADGAVFCAGGDLGCLLNLAGRARRESIDIEVRHVA